MKLTNENFLLYCAKIYENPQCYDIKEFVEDIKRIKYIKKLFTRYTACQELKERLILNHIIVLHNVFGPNTCKILFFKIEKIQWPLLKPFLVLLNILPLTIDGVDEQKLYTDEITMDMKIVEILRSI